MPVLACRDALRAAGATVEIIQAGSDDQIDAVIARAERARVVVAAEAVGQLRAVVRRMVRRYAPPPSTRSAERADPPDLPPDRTVRDLPPIGVLPLAGVFGWLAVPERPADVAAAVIGGRSRRLDLLRTDSGSVTLDGALVGGADADGRPVPFTARVEVDDTVLSDGDEPLLCAAVLNADGHATLDGLPLVTTADAADGALDVAVAVPAAAGRWPRRRLGIEVRRARGRAAVVHPTEAVPFVDDGVAGDLGRRRTWWMERAALAVYAA